MLRLSEVQVSAESIDRFASVIGDERAGRFKAIADEAADQLRGRTVWNVNSTAAGGGVAEMLQVLLAYARGSGIDTRWLVMAGEPVFFAITKRIHNRLHGQDAGPLTEADRSAYERITEMNARQFAELVDPGDIVLLHDPQTAGMAPRLRESGAHVVWRCHIGTDRPNSVVTDTWAFLRPYLEGLSGYVFSRHDHVHAWMPESRVQIIPPSIDPFSPKNQELSPEAVRAILLRARLLTRDGDAMAQFHRRDGSPGQVVRRAALVRGQPLEPDSPLVVQVSRWDRLKDMSGVMRGFAEHVPAPGELALVGPSVEGVADDPEGAQVLDECAGIWDDLPDSVRQRIRLVTLPMDDVDENAAMVNAIQRHATVVVQKSLQEGFGLTVGEALIKSRPVIASRVGGIQDQITHAEDGLLLDDPADLDTFGHMLAELLDDPGERARLGKAGRQRVLESYIGDRHLTQYAELMSRLVASER